MIHPQALVGEASFSEADQRWMHMALQVASEGRGCVQPNPMVGCVLVRDDRLIASGFHAKFGGPHAERAAIQAAIDAGKTLQLAGCTAYVTLEPCCHHGKTPPCTDALIEVGVARVVAAMLDPFPAVAGKGAKLLREHGVRVDVGLLQEQARELNAAYIKRIETGRPWVIGKWAMSLDGRIATATGDSQWISGSTSRQSVHQLRAIVDAIMVGRGTVLADDPLLTARLDGDQHPPRQALRVVVDARATIPIGSQLVQSARQIPVLVWASSQASDEAVEALQDLGCRVHRCSLAATDPAWRSQGLDQLLQFLVQQYAVTYLMVEGGGQLLGSLFDLRQIDQCEVYIAAKLIGGDKAVSPLAGVGVSQVVDGPQCYDCHWRALEGDMHLSCKLRWDKQSG